MLKNQANRHTKLKGKENGWVGTAKRLFCPGMRVILPYIEYRPVARTPTKTP